GGHRAMDVSRQNRRSAALVARGRVFLLIRSIMSFVHYSEAQILNRCKNGCPRADGDAFFSLLQRSPGSISFAIRQPTVQHCNIVAKYFIKSADNLWSEANFGYEY